MDDSYAVATQFVDWEVMPDNFAPDKLNREELQDLAQKIICVCQEDFDFKTRITVKLMDGVNDVVEMVEAPRVCSRKWAT